VEVDRTPPLVLGHLGERDPHQPPQLPLAHAGELRQGPIQVDGGPRPQLPGQGIPEHLGAGLVWLARGQLSNPTDVAVYPQQVPATTIDDDGNQITAITASKRGALAVTYTRADGLTVQALTAHLKSKLLTFPGHDPQHSQFDTRDEAVRARFGLYALNQRAAEAVTIRAWATEQLQGHGQKRHLLVCGDLNDTPRPPPPSSCLGVPAPSWAPEGSTSRTGVTATGCGTWPPRCPPATR
jgi:hypothetical protein